MMSQLPMTIEILVTCLVRCTWMKMKPEPDYMNRKDGEVSFLQMECTGNILRMTEDMTC